MIMLCNNLQTDPICCRHKATQIALLPDLSNFFVLSNVEHQHMIWSLFQKPCPSRIQISYDSSEIFYAFKFDLYVLVYLYLSLFIIYKEQ